MVAPLPAPIAPSRHRHPTHGEVGKHGAPVPAPAKSIIDHCSGHADGRKSVIAGNKIPMDSHSGLNISSDCCYDQAAGNEILYVDRRPDPTADSENFYHGSEKEFDDNWTASDDVKGGVLPAHLVRDARAKEHRYLQEHRVYKYASIADCIRCTGRRPLGLRWIDTNKGDSSAPLVRSRLVH